MSNTREIVTKAVVGKGKKNFTTTKQITPEFTPNTILGCWIINHDFKGTKINNKIVIEGSYDTNIWYSCSDDTKTEVVKDKTTYKEEVNVPNTNNDENVINEEVVIRSLKQPTCTRCDIIDGKIEYTVEKEMGVEIVGDVKVKISYDNEEDPWDNLEEEKIENQAKIEEEIEKEVNEEYLN